MSGERDDLAARLEARADNADKMAAEVARNPSNYGESGPRHHARLLAAAYAFRKAAEMARASTHPEQGEARVDYHKAGEEMLLEALRRLRPAAGRLIDLSLRLALETGNDELKQAAQEAGAANLYAGATAIRFLEPAPEQGEVRFAAAVAAEVARARAKFPGADHMYGALAEEVGEVAKSLLEEHDRDDLRAECVQVAAMAQRLAEEGDNDYPASLPTPEGEAS